MNFSKIKKHFSLFMVKKSIKKQKSDYNLTDSSKENPEKNNQKIQKYIDPIKFYHLYGDMYFQDKLYDEDIALLSPCNFFKRITNFDYNPDNDYWGVYFTSVNFNLDSWGLVHDRLLTLGDQNAFDLAQTIESEYLLWNKKLTYDQHEINTEILGEKYQIFYNDFENFLQTKKNSKYFFGKYQGNSSNGFEVYQMGLSKSLIEIIFEKDYFFIDYVMNYGLFDFLTIEKERYFDFIRNSILTVRQECQIMELKFETLDGHYQYIIPQMERRFFVSEKGNLIELIVFFEINLMEDFVKKVFTDRNIKNKSKTKLGVRECNLDNMLNAYYKNEEFFKRKSYENNNTKEELFPVKRCGYKVIN